MKTAVPLAAASDVSSTESAPRSLVAILLDLTKARLTFLVLVTTFVGFYMGSGPLLDISRLAACLAGTLFCAAGAAVFNQVWEKNPDALMHRTRQRPLPAKEMPASVASWIGFGLCLVGIAILWQGASVLAAALSLATIGSYLLIYTPLKKVTSLNTLVGAVPGALPPVIGYAAASGRLDLFAGLLFGILFFWQLPHFLAISWVYREDYQRGGFVMLSCRDETGLEVARKAVFWLILLIGASVLPFFVHANGIIYLVVALILGLAFLWPALRFLKLRSSANARKLFFASIIYLPLLLAVMILTRR